MKIAKNKALLSPRGVRIASSVSDHHWHCRPAVAVPVRGAGCIIHSSLKLSWLILPLPSPRGVRVASRARRQGRARHEVAVPVRGAGCIPHGKQELQGQELHHFSVPVRGAGCIGVVRKKNNFITLLPSPRGVRVASSEDCCCYRRFWLPSPRGVRVASIRAAQRSLAVRSVAVPARGAGCISKRIQTRISTFVGSIQPAGSV